MKSPVQYFSTAVVTALFLVTTAYSDLFAADKPKYIVEVLVFENQISSDGEEKFDGQKDAPKTSGAVLLSSNNEGMLRLKSNKLQLAGAARLLKRSGKYRVVSHLAWKQPGLPRKKAKAVRIKSPDGVLDGAIRLEQGQYLHLFIDLGFNERSSQTLHLKQQRRVRKKELHYFDHPRFGVIATVRSEDS